MEQENKEKSLEVQPEKVLPILAGLIDPDEQVKWGQRAAGALIAVIKTKKHPVMMGGEQYLEYEDWQLLARFYNYTVGTDWTKEISREGKLFGFEARAVVRNAAGMIIASAEASCLRDEPKWNTRTKYGWENGKRIKVGEDSVPEFQLKSMAQTRACAKALRNVLGWVVILAGYKPTPAEELDGLVQTPQANGNGAQTGEYGEPIGTDKPAGKPPFPAKPNPHSPAAKIMKKAALICGDCKEKISVAESDFSLRKYKKELCRNCQSAYAA